MSDAYEKYQHHALHFPPTPGPCRVGTDSFNWYVVNDKTRTVRKIGRVGAPRTNYFNKAMEYAETKNREYVGGLYCIDLDKLVRS